jgi:plasmid maintenance system killer protein
MIVRSITHKGLCHLYEENSSKGTSADTVDKLRKTLTFLDAMENPEELRALPLRKAPVLTGDRKEPERHAQPAPDRIEDEEIVDLNLEDYH